VYTQPTRVAAPSPRASLGRRTVCGRTEQRRPPVSKRYETKVRMGVWGSFLIAAAALKTPTRTGSNAQGATSLFAVCLLCLGVAGRHEDARNGARDQHAADAATPALSTATVTQKAPAKPLVDWPIQDILSIVLVCARIDHPFITPAHSYYLQYYCATFAPYISSPRPALFAPPSPNRRRPSLSQP